MKLGDGVEQAIHCAALLANLEGGAVLSARALAEFHGVSPSYLLKHLQALSGAGLVEATQGPTGGYRLARAPREITLLDLVLAVEGPEPAFQCAEIRRRGPNPGPAPSRICEIHAAMLRAEKAYRHELAQITVADLGRQVRRNDKSGQVAQRSERFVQLHARGGAAR